MSKTFKNPLNSERAKDLNVFIFKQSIGKNPNVFSDVLAKETSDYDTRNKSKFISKLYFNTLCQQSISYCGPAF